MTEEVTIGNAEIWHGDCLERTKEIPAGSVDLVLTSSRYHAVL